MCFCIYEISTTISSVIFILDGKSCGAQLEISRFSCKRNAKVQISMFVWHVYSAPLLVLNFLTSITANVATYIITIL